jgi:hypothetical protein
MGVHEPKKEQVAVRRRLRVLMAAPHSVSRSAKNAPMTAETISRKAMRQIPERAGRGQCWSSMGKRPDGTRGKRPPAPSVRRPRRRATGPDIVAQIGGELYATLERLDAEPELLAIVGSWRDTLSDDEVLATLRDYRAGRLVLYRRQ